ncbi:MAG: hypothetical protein J3R72DRAFT_440913 [Linnemannia gamsii]|nr:MAG: hypothetical protein J3R72DRAFT_440913 [Linnemannia gamsii]
MLCFPHSHTNGRVSPLLILPMFFFIVFRVCWKSLFLLDLKESDETWHITWVIAFFRCILSTSALLQFSAL